MGNLTVLHINKYHYNRDGASNVYLRTASLLESYGHRSVFFSMHSDNNISCETDKFFVSGIDLNAADLSLLSRLSIAGRFIYSFEAKKKLSLLLDKFPVDIAHIHNIYHHISPSILHELRRRKIPVVMTLHDYKLVCGSHALLHDGKPCEACSGRNHLYAVKKKCVKDSYMKSLLTAMEMYFHHKVLDIYENVNIFISPSVFLLEKHKELGYKKEIVHLPNFIDIKELVGRNSIENEKIKTEANSFIYIGRISVEKGLRTLIEAAKIIANIKSKKKIQIKIIGDGPIKEELLGKVAKDKIDNVQFVGYLKGIDLFTEVGKSMALILPSEWYENNPLSVLEAFVLGKPVIGARIGGIPELVRDYETGLTYESGNARDLCEKILYFINNHDKVAEMGSNAEKFMIREVNPKQHYEKLMEIYERAKTKNALRLSKS